MDAADKKQLEQMIAEHGLKQINATIAEICHEQSVYYKSQSQYDQIAGKWERTAKFYENLKIPT